MNWINYESNSSINLNLNLLNMFEKLVLCTMYFNRPHVCRLINDELDSFAVLSDLNIDCSQCTTLPLLMNIITFILLYI